jgi:hypothetical protein
MEMYLTKQCRLKRKLLYLPFYSHSKTSKSRDRESQMVAMKRLLKFGEDSKNNIRSARKLKDDYLGDECTFEPHFYTNALSRKNAKPSRKSQSTMILEMEYVYFKFANFLNCYYTNLINIDVKML